jgi:cation-transporting ATPase 13A2
MENNLNFTGFFIMENKIKQVSPSIIKLLSEAGVRNVMVTGDNPLTAISIGR